jgi:type I restriction-modification system DNA methylase subunit
MTDLHQSIQQHLDHAHHPDRLRGLFCQTLFWGALSGSGQHLPKSGPQQEDLIAHPVAELGGVPVFRIEWPASALPTVTQRRKVQHTLAPAALEHLLCYVTSDGQRVALVWARSRGSRQVELRTLPYEVGTPARTTIERLAHLAFTLDALSSVTATTVLDRVNEAFNVEAVTKQFFERYRAHFEQAEQRITGVSSADARRLFTQKLFNRLLFLVFLERKGWLTFQGRTDYLRALWDAHQQERLTDPAATFYRNRLKLLFFAGLNTPHDVNVVDITHQGVLAERIGQVPYLNGGLFEEEAADRDDAITVPDDALEGPLTDLFYAFNFTVSESTPFDIEVAVDPEMLGKIFEELVTGRHESGSYYTPRPVVAFMCREGLKGYLTARLPHEPPEVIACFVDERGAADLHDPEAALEALKAVRVCDPACGSGAYLLGMLQEILSLRTGLFAARQVDATTTYRRKLELIQSNLYGVDVDPFAVNIARLRLWLSLAVDFDGDTPEPLPNLDYKLEVGDSLVAPDPSGGLQPDMLRQQAIDDYFHLKEAYLRSHGEEKLTLREQVQAQKQQIATWTRGTTQVQGFDWQVEFAEVFADGGFDVVVANPPYVRQELIKEIKPALKPIYSEVYTGTSDLYVYFYARALQMLRPGGMLVFISSNKWFRAGYGKKLRQHLAAQTRIHSITDFGDLPVFGATAYPVIFVGQKGESDGAVRFTPVKTLEPPYPDVLMLVQEQGQPLPPEAIQGENWHLESAAAVRLMAKLRTAGTPLGEYVQGRFYRGILTGLNDAFVVDRATRDWLIAEHPSSAEVLKPFLRGKDVKRWRAAFADKYLIRIESSENKQHLWSGKPEQQAERIFAKTYPAIHGWFEQFRERLINRYDQGHYFWELRACAYWQEFDKTKIIYPDIASEPRFATDTNGFYSGDTTFYTPTNDFFLIGVLNSILTTFFYMGLSSQVRGGYLRFKTQYVSQIPIPDAPAAERKAIAKLAQQCVEAKGQGAQVAAWEAEIDARVARLFGLTAAEVALALAGKVGL